MARPAAPLPACGGRGWGSHPGTAVLAPLEAPCSPPLLPLPPGGWTCQRGPACLRGGRNSRQAGVWVQSGRACRPAYTAGRRWRGLASHPGSNAPESSRMINSISWACAVDPGPAATAAAACCGSTGSGCPGSGCGRPGSAKPCAAKRAAMLLGPAPSAAAGSTGGSRGPMPAVPSPGRGSGKAATAAADVASTLMSKVSGPTARDTAGRPGGRAAPSGCCSWPLLSAFFRRAGPASLAACSN